MNKRKANAQRAVTARTRTYQDHTAAVVEMLPEGYPKVAEVIEEEFDIVDQASWDSFPASDPPSWIFSKIRS